MLFKRRIREGIAAGTVTMAFRRWRRPTVKAGGTLQAGVGLLAIDSVEPIGADTITTRDATSAGYTSVEELLATLGDREGRLYRVTFHLAGPDPRIALREDATLSDAALDALRKRLANLDKRSPTGPWTSRILQTIADHPGVRAADLAVALEVDKDWLKPNVRKLKNLGLTESIEIGYRISPRGEAFMRRQTEG